MTAVLKAVPGPFRQPLLAAVLLVVALIACEVMPGTSPGSRGAPPAILFEGLVYGSITALTAAGLVLLYRTIRVINFAQTAIGTGGAAMCFAMMQMTPLPFAVDFLLSILLGAGLGVAVHLIFGIRFANAPRLVLMVVTVAAAGWLAGNAQTFVNGLPFFPPVGQRSLDEVQGTADMQPLLPFPDFKFYVGGLQIPFHFAELFTIGVVVVTLLAVAAFLRFTRLGVAVRAMAENSERANLLGISTGLLTLLVWAIAGSLAAIGLTLTGLLSQPASAAGIAPEVLLPALAAGVLARMENLTVAAAAALAISWLSQSIQFLQPDYLHLVTLGEMVIVAGGLLLQSRRRGRSEQGATSSWQALEEMRPMPTEMSSLTGVRVAKYGAIAVILAGLGVYPFVTSSGQTFLVSYIFLEAIVGVSLVVLTGWAGQVSLGQFGFAAIGTVVAAALAVKLNMSFWLAVPLATVITAGIAMLIGLPALRIPGLFLAAATFAFAIAVRDVLFDPKFFGWLVPDGGVTRPTLFGVDFDDEKSMYFLSAAALALAVVLVLNLRRTRFGRILIAVRDNDANAESAGVPVFWMKLQAFGVAGGLAGFAGAVLAFQQRGITADSFGPQASIDIFVWAVVGGLASPFGPLIGTALTTVAQQAFVGIPEVLFLVGLLPLILLWIAPGGLLSVYQRLRDGSLRIIAQRNQLIVPSLFPEMDAEALQARLIPMGASLQGSGLARLRRRYRINTSMHAARQMAAVAAREAAAISAAAKSAASVLEGGPGPEMRPEGTDR